MQKHYKLTAGLLVCVLGVGLKAMEEETREQYERINAKMKEQVAELRTTARSCAVEPQDLQDATSSPDARLAKVRQMATFRAIDKLSKTLKQVNAISEGVLSPVTAAARQAAEDMEVGSAGDVVLKDSLTLIDKMIRRGENTANPCPDFFTWNYKHVDRTFRKIPFFTCFQINQTEFEKAYRLQTHSDSVKTRFAATLDILLSEIFKTMHCRPEILIAINEKVYRVHYVNHDVVLFTDPQFKMGPAIPEHPGLYEIIPA